MPTHPKLTVPHPGPPWESRRLGCLGVLPDHVRGGGGPANPWTPENSRSGPANWRWPGRPGGLAGAGVAPGLSLTHPPRVATPTGWPHLGALGRRGRNAGSQSGLGEAFSVSPPTRSLRARRRLRQRAVQRAPVPGSVTLLTAGPGCALGLVGPPGEPHHGSGGRGGVRPRGGSAQARGARR